MMERLLRMLLVDVSREDFESAVAEVSEKLAHQSSTGETLEAVREVEVAVELRAEIERLRRRAHELRGLFDTAGDLSSLRDVEKVLQAIARRSRQLLDADVAYLMLIDEDRGDTYMRITDGTVSPDFIGIRLPSGVGLGGLVAASMSPHWTSNYLEDRRYVHVIDEIVNDEHLVAILGVPLKIGRRLLGVLFAADRQPRTFSQDEISLLSSLADHAAIAIENASLFQETQSVMNEIATANEIVESANNRLQGSIEVHERLMDLALTNGSISDVAVTVTGVVGGSLLVLDPEGREIARAHSGTHSDPETWAKGALFESSEFADVLSRAESERRTFKANIEGQEHHVVPIAAGDGYFGVIVFLGFHPSDFDGSILEWASMVMALLLLGTRAQDEAENRFRGELLVELLTSRTEDRDGITRRARLLAVDLDKQWSVVVALPVSRVVTRALRATATALARSMRGLVAIHGDHVVFLIPYDEVSDIATAVAQRLNRLADSPVTVGVAGPSLDLALVASLEDQAKACAKAMESLGRAGHGGTSDQLGIYALLLADAGKAHFQAWIKSTLGPVLEYDRARGTTLLVTLASYFEHEGHVAAAAEVLFLHVNTLYQRLERLDKLLGNSWRSGDRALELRLALRLHRLNGM